jgi:hypothetical protein
MQRTQKALIWLISCVSTENGFIKPRFEKLTFSILHIPVQLFLCSRWRYRECTPHCAGAAVCSWRKTWIAASVPCTDCHSTTPPATISCDVTPPSTECTPVLPRPVTATHRCTNCCRGRALADIIIIIIAGEEMIPALTSERHHIAFNLFTRNVYTILYTCPDL